MGTKFYIFMTLACLIFSSRLYAWTGPSGFKAGYGLLEVKSADHEEINKKGTVKTASLTVEGRWKILMVGMGLGMQVSDLKGENTDRGINQFYRVTSPIFDTNIHFRIFYGLFVGAVYRVQFGEGANYAIDAENTTMYMQSFAPSLIYRTIVRGKVALFIEANQFQDLNNKERKVTSKIISIGFRYTPMGV